MNDLDLQKQTQILTLLHKNREQGAELLLETYTPLLWSVCEKRISDPEDIRECINDVFVEFCMNLDKFDSQKSSLKNYLAMIADRRAISYFRRNQRRNETEAAAACSEYSEQMELHSELEEALSKLKPKDAYILRQKYYGGMTYGEIARQMGIAEDAVKKRGTRSLRKLAKWMIVGLLIAALLAGCVYVIRHFYYTKGLGISWDTETFVYQLAETPEPVILNGVNWHLLSVSYSDGSVTAIAAHYPEDNTMDRDFFSNLTGGYLLSVNGGETISGSYHSNVMTEYHIRIPADTLTADENGQIHLQIRLTPSEGSAENLKQNFDYDMDLSEIGWDVTLEQTEVQQSLTDLGYFLETEYADFLVMTDWEYAQESEATYTFISLYPIYKGEGYNLSGLVSSWYMVVDKTEAEGITLTDEAGNSYPLYQTMSPSINSTVSAVTMSFRNVPPGEYTLNIPRLCYQFEEECDPITLYLPKEDGELLACDQEFSLPYGSAIRYSGITRQTTTRESNFMVESWEDGVQVWTVEEDTEIRWNYALDYEVTTDEAFSFYGFTWKVTYYHADETGLALIATGQERGGYETGLDSMTMWARAGLGMEAPDALRIQFQSLCYADMQEYAVPVTIK